VSFQEAVQTVLTKKYADFSGRARRSEYWWWFVAYLIGAIVVGIIDGIIGTSILEFIYIIAVICPNLAVGVRRLHDTGKSGWWLLIGLIPLIGAIVLIVFFATDGDQLDNQYGPSPKGAGYNQGMTPNWS
jgi:uncharacterized membrane protein YhaH (DUF805 family)